MVKLILNNNSTLIGKIYYETNDYIKFQYVISDKYKSEIIMGFKRSEIKSIERNGDD